MAKHSDHPFENLQLFLSLAQLPMFIIIRVLGGLAIVRAESLAPFASRGTRLQAKESDEYLPVYYHLINWILVLALIVDISAV